MEAVLLSDIELYYSSNVPQNNIIFIDGEEAHHIKDVMRHSMGDEIFITNGNGIIYRSIIETISRTNINCKVAEETKYDNKLANITFCIARLKSSDRFEFALEKSVELGITNFIVFDSIRTVAKGEKIDRWKKILISAMKQSLISWLPKINYVKKVSDILQLDGGKIIFDQNSETTFQQFLIIESQSLKTEKYFLLFGPEGGFTDDELKIESFNNEGALRMRLTENRLRSETAIVTAASLISTLNK